MIISSSHGQAGESGKCCIVDPQSPGVDPQALGRCPTRQRPDAGNQVREMKGMADGYGLPGACHLRVRALFISDLHLGTRDCQAERLLDLLRSCETDLIYLVGDVVDGWRLKVRWYWPRSHDDIVRCLLRKQQEGTRILYLPGNHDEFLRDSIGLRLGGIEVVDQAMHQGADGRRHLVMHGDRFDPRLGRMRQLAALGIWVYAAAVLANDAVIRWRRRMGGKTGRGPACVARFERALAAEAQRQQADGVICGHIHRPAMHHRLGVQYINTGDWVEACTAAVEHLDGSFEMLHCPVGLRMPPAEAFEADAMLAPRREPLRAPLGEQVGSPVAGPVGSPSGSPLGGSLGRAAVTLHS
ncbi:MAG TPA: UDP-2,3-diacylglucosamine diphosphatase [Acetobacteraceae bacterium]|nr:UDP-2,3-diacylglucosamine diphosphatase [Acetobacteraceae bacterium]